MHMTRASLLSACIVSLGGTSLHADELLFSVLPYMAGINGRGHVGSDEDNPMASWAATEDGLSDFVHQANIGPHEFEELATSPLGGASYGYAMCNTEFDTANRNIHVQAAALGVTSGGDAGEFSKSWAMTHGEFQIVVWRPSKVWYELCNDTNQPGTWGRLDIGQVGGGSFELLVEHRTGPNGGYECVRGELEFQPGTYQIYFSATVSINNDMIGLNGWEFGRVDVEANLNFEPLSEEIQGDITGDGMVDGADLALILAAWGTSSSEADVNGDGVVDGADLAIVLSNWS